MINAIQRVTIPTLRWDLLSSPVGIGFCCLLCCLSRFDQILYVNWDSVLSGIGINTTYELYFWVVFRLQIEAKCCK